MTKARKPANKQTRASGGTLKSPPRWLYEALCGFDGKTAAGVSIGYESAMALSAVWACVRVISETFGSLPWFVYRRTEDGGREKADGHEVYSLLHGSPNPDMTAMVWKEVSASHCLTWGNCYSEIVRDGGEQIAALYPIHPSRVTPKRTNTGRLVYDVTNDTRPTATLEAYQVFHVPGLGCDGIMGYSVIQKARESMGLTAGSERFGASFFGNGSHSGGVLKHPKSLTDKARKNLKDSIEAARRGSENAFRLLLLEEGLDFSVTSINPNDAQFLETRQFQVEGICRWFRVQPHKIQHLLHATFSNIEHQSIEFVTDTIRPWLVRFEQEANRKLIRPSQQGIYYTENLVDALLRGDALSRSQALEVQHRNGALLGDEWRAIENRNPLPNGLGKRPLVTVNTVPLDRVDDQIDAKAAPKPSDPATSGVADRANAAGFVARHLASISATRGDRAAEAESMRLLSLLQTNLEG